jgi:hypothetical protein
MTGPTRRALTIDDPLAGREACHVAQAGPDETPDGQVRHLPLGDIDQAASNLDCRFVNRVEASWRYRAGKL